MSFAMQACDFAAHNEEARAVWAAYRAGAPIRVPVHLETDTRFFLLENEAVNPGGRTSFADYFADAATMMDVQLRAALWRAFTIAPLCDDQAGMPDEFKVTVDTQRIFDAGFFGAEVVFANGQTPDTRPLLAGGYKRLLFDRGLPDPLTGGFFADAHHLHAAMADHVDRGFTFHERPVHIAPFGLGTDGPLTVATNLRGAELFADFYDDADYVHQLLDFIVEGTIARIVAHRRFFGLPDVSDSFGFADDAIQLISTDMVREFVLPAHRKLKARLTRAERISIHLCGDATRHFRTLRDELGVDSFDTGFPVDFTWLRAELGPQVEIWGGPRVTLLRNGTPAAVATEVQRILGTGIMQGGRFVLREANDLSPGTPFANLHAMYSTARAYGEYEIRKDTIA
jgi:hypothetical protein